MDDSISHQLAFAGETIRKARDGTSLDYETATWLQSFRTSNPAYFDVPNDSPAHNDFSFISSSNGRSDLRSAHAHHLLRLRAQGELSRNDQGWLSVFMAENPQVFDAVESELSNTPSRACAGVGARSASLLDLSDVSLPSTQAALEPNARQAVLQSFLRSRHNHTHASPPSVTPPRPVQPNAHGDTPLGTHDNTQPQPTTPVPPRRTRHGGRRHRGAGSRDPEPNENAAASSTALPVQPAALLARLNLDQNTPTDPQPTSPRPTRTTNLSPSYLNGANTASAAFVAAAATRPFSTSRIPSPILTASPSSTAEIDRMVGLLKAQYAAKHQELLSALEHVSTAMTLEADLRQLEVEMANLRGQRDAASRDERVEPEASFLI